MVDGKVYKKTREKMEEISYYVQVVHIIPHAIHALKNASKTSPPCLPSLLSKDNLRGENRLKLTEGRLNGMVHMMTHRQPLTSSSVAGWDRRLSERAIAEGFFASTEKTGVGNQQIEF